MSDERRRLPGNGFAMDPGARSEGGRRLRGVDSGKVAVPGTSSKTIAFAFPFLLGVLAGCATRHGDPGVCHSFQSSDPIGQTWSDAREAFEGAGVYVGSARRGANAERINFLSSLDLGTVAGCTAPGRVRVALRLRQVSTGETAVSISVSGHPRNSLDAGCLHALQSWTREIAERISA